MAKWRLFGKSKAKEEEKPETQEIKEETVEEPIETTSEPEDKPIAEYHETLHTGSTSKKQTTTSKPTSDQRIWRDVDSIENNVDKLHIKKAQKPVTEVDKTVDKLIAKRKKK